MNTLNLLSEEGRSRIKYKINPFDEIGLKGQFPKLTEQFKAAKVLRAKLFKRAEETVVKVLADDEFAGFRRYCDGPNCCVMATEKLNLILEGVVRARQVTFLWSVQQYNLNHHLMLALIGNKLHVCTSEYVYQDQYMATGVHWFRILEDRQKEELDSSRLMDILKILSHTKTAQKYLRAHVRSLEME